MTNSVYALRPDVVASVLETGAVLLDLDTKYFYSLNTTGWAIVQLFEVGATREDVSAACQGWQATAEDQEKIESFISFLESEGIIQAGAAAEAGPPIDPPATWVDPTVEKHKEPLQQIMTSAFDPTMPLAE